MGTIPFTIVPATVTSSGLTFSGNQSEQRHHYPRTFNLTSLIVGGPTQVWSSSALTGQANLTGSITLGVVKTGAVATRLMPALESFEDFARA